MGVQISWKTFLARPVQPQPMVKGDVTFLQLYRTYPPEAFKELTGGPAAPSPPLWRASDANDNSHNGPTVTAATLSLEQRVQHRLVEIAQQTFGITDPRVIDMVEELLPSSLSAADASAVMGIVVDTAFDQDASSDFLRIGAQRALDTLLEKSDLARMFWQAACFRALGGTITDEKTTVNDETGRDIYNMLLGHIVDHRLDSPLHYAAKTFLTYIRTSFEHILPSACKEKAVQIRASFAHHDPSDLENLISGLGEISTKYRTVISWLHRDSDEVVGEIEGLIDMLREGNAAQTFFAMSALPLVMQGGLSPDSPQLDKVADSLHHIMLSGIETHNYECTMAAFAQIRNILPPEKVKYVESHLGAQKDAYAEILAKVLEGYSF